ncbi:hypothetical protein LR48_Vigan10g182500 [Vigna angularis]|uniref:Zinc-finger domain-containing protein n=1 Tax=Phaseolus angularis TaxID=3914 RepID=A0A0L9VLS1_PHAAN|nr:hypothetical protein LR48_Vigan10g182500 [Vigna angularis]
MDVRLSSAQTKNSEDVVASPPLQIGGTGKSCHQCRQKKENFAATCKNLKKGKNCPIKYCHKCLLTRYGENAEEVAQLANWTCPKCRGICNCSLCQKRRGEQPTGPLYRSAKESGFKSVAEMLAMKKNLETSNPLNEGTLYQSAKGYDFKSVAEILTVKKTSETLNPSHKDSVKKALDLKEAEAETIFKELISEESMDEHNSSLIQFHIRLLALIVSNSKKESPSFSTKNETNSWLKHLEDLIMQSYHLNDFPVDWFQEGISGYYKLDLCKKFKLMTLLCDEALNTQ